MVLETWEPLPFHFALLGTGAFDAICTRILSRIRDIRLILEIGPKIDFSAFFALFVNSGIAANLRKLHILEPAFENPLQHLQPLITFVLESNKVISELDYRMRTLTTEHISMLRRFLELPHFKRLNQPV
ncbi:hypothetical protein QR680_012362 [Steinernema hermaphroditum]|uniref:Uncharacterized protein n=1 Tax=Steinernema hermaphroditum TaxID=289476 RepID=A0AA39I4J1_9BILA|nr:hypothetical protein QR680_012362 [Steinernema hermaphroditum]